MKPDFSGEWILNREASTLSPGADTVQSGVWHIDHQDPTFRHKAVFIMESGPRSYEYELRSDAGEVVGTENEMTMVTSLVWDGDALVVAWRTVHSSGETTISFRHELIDDGRRLRASEQLRGTDHDQDNVWVFDRA